MNTNLAPNALRKPVKASKKPRRPIHKRTAKRASEEAAYRKRVKEWLVGETCVLIGCGEPAQCNHHRNGRRGKLLAYEPFWIPVCNACHYWIHFVNPEKAQKLGLLGNASEWNNQSPVGQFNTMPKDL